MTRDRSIGPLIPRLIKIPRDLVPAVTADQMREVDRLAVEEFGLQLFQMMENAGRSLADLAISLFGRERTVVLAGPGGNGGGGLVAARHLANRGVEVRVVLARPVSELDPAPSRQLDILRRVGVPVQDDPPGADLILDALIGYSLRGNPRGRAAELIEWANAGPAPVLALDTPSGLDVTTGTLGEPCIGARATLTLALPKVGLYRAPEQVGRLFLADISVPSIVYQRLGLEVPPLFREEAVVELV